MTAEVAMDEDVLRIQRMVADKKITPEESLELLASLGKDVGAIPGPHSNLIVGSEPPPKSIREAIIRNMTRRVTPEERAQILETDRVYWNSQQATEFTTTGLYMVFFGAAIAVGGTAVALIFAKDAGLNPLSISVMCGAALIGGSVVASISAHHTLSRARTDGLPVSKRE